MFKLNRIAGVVSLALALPSWNALAALEQVGPVSNDPAIGGYPAWYKDTTGVALEFCDPKNQAEVDGGWCLLIGADVATVPERFPSAFADEHFWFAADAAMTAANGGQATLGLAVEAAFAADVTPGGQIAFSRIRVRLTDVPVTGKYRFIHPYGEEVLDGVAGGRIFFTDDVGINCAPGQFDCAMESRLGPFLLPSDTPGGAELPPVAGPVTGKRYIADPARSGPVTGSPLPDFVDSSGRMRNHNIFRIEGPAGSNLGGPGIDFIETESFSLVGRLFSGPISGQVELERATHSRDPERGEKLDVFATAFPTTQGRLPGDPPQPQTAPQLSVYAAPCLGVLDENGQVVPPYRAPDGTSTPMWSNGKGGSYWVPLAPADGVPAEICIKNESARDANGQIVPVYLPMRVTDDIAIRSAYFDATVGKLTVVAEATGPQLLEVVAGSERKSVENGMATFENMIAPPAYVRLYSREKGGMAEAPVKTEGLTGSPPQVDSLVAVNDTYAVDEDSAKMPLDVLTNDSGAIDGTATITIVSPPRLGTVTPVVGAVEYTATPDANGTDQFTYTVTVGNTVSNAATVTVQIAPVNDAPSAAPDAFQVLAGQTVQFDVLANDADPDGASDLVSVANVSAVTGPGAASAVASGRYVSFTAAEPGAAYTFTYRAQDSAGATATEPATVTVQVMAAETLAVTRSDYIRNKTRLRADGTLSPAANQRVTLDILDSNGSIFRSFEVVSDAAGAWTLDTILALTFNNARLRAKSANGTEVIRSILYK